MILSIVNAKQILNSHVSATYRISVGGLCWTEKTMVYPCNGRTTLLADRFSGLLCVLFGVPIWFYGSIFFFHVQPIRQTA